MDRIFSGTRARGGDIAGDSSAPRPNRREFVAGICAAALVAAAQPSASGANRVVIVRDVHLDGGPSRGDVAGAALDLAIAAFADTATAESAWKRIFAGATAASLKVELRSPLASTTPALIVAALDRLFRAGIKPWRAHVWDKRAADVRRAAISLATSQGEIACVAGEPRNQGDSDPTGYRTELNCRFPAVEAVEAPAVALNTLAAPEDGALVLMPTARQHPLFGVDGALAAALTCVNGAAALRAEPEVLPERLAQVWNQLLAPLHRLTIMDAGSCIFEGGPIGLAAWRVAERAIIIGADPVAVDTVALDLIDARRAAVGLPTLKPLAEPFLAAAEKAGIGTTAPVVIRLNAPRGV